jgi:DNA-binding transcriptional MerR regulator
MMLALLQATPTTDGLSQMLDLQDKFGTEKVIAGLVLLVLMGVSAAAICHWRRVANLRLEEEKANNRLMREQQSEMFKHILNGNGDKNQPSLRMLVDSVNALNEQVHAHLAGERPMVDCRDWITSEVSRIVEKSLKGMEARIAEIVRLAERTRDEVREMLRDAERKIDAAAVLAQQKVLAEADRVASQLASNGHD